MCQIVIFERILRKMIYQQAEVMGFLRTLLIILLIYYGFKFLARLFAPFLMKKAVEKMQQKAEQQFGGQRNQRKESNIREGETVIDKKPTQTKQSNNNVGEYVDFEEVD